MTNTAMSVEAVAAESAKKSVIINRNASEVMSLQKALGNFCKLLNNHDDSDNEVKIIYTARITSDFKVQFYFFRPNSEGYDYNTYMYIGLEEKYDGRWSNSTPINASAKDSRDVWALVDEVMEKAKSKYSTKDYRAAKELMTAILAA